MTTGSIRCALLAAALTAVTVSAQSPAAPPAFRFERPVVAGGAGPTRLPIDVPLLAGGAPFKVTSRSSDPRTGTPIFGVGGGLTDLRFYDNGGTEIAYLLISQTPPPPTSGCWREPFEPRRWRPGGSTTHCS